MLKVTNYTGTTSGTQLLKFPTDVNPRGTYKHHLEVSIDTGADVNCMNEKTFKKLFPKVELSVCPHRIQNFGNSTADVYILGQFRVYLRFRGRKYLNTFIVTNANDCPNILSYGAIFRMGILVPNYPEENMVKSRDMETGTSNVFQVLQDLRMKQYQGNSEPKAHRPNTTEPKASNTPKSCKTASQKAGTTTHTDNMSPIQTSFRTIPTPEPNTAHSTRRPASRKHQLHSHSEPKTCCMHEHQQQSQTYKTGEPSALREVKHPYRDRTSVSRSPSTEQGVLSQFSGYSEEIEHFTRDPYKSHLKSCLQSTEHASKEQEVNTCTNCEHSYRHMNDHLTQNTGRMQQRHLQHFSHAEFLPGMENTPAFLGKQFLQGKEENVDTCTFVSGNTTLSTPTHLRKIPQNFQQLEKESSNTVVLPGFNHNADTTTYVETSRNAHSNGTLSTNLKTDTNKYANMDTNHTAHRYRDTKKEVHLLSGPSELRPLKAMAHRDTRKEVHLLSRPSELQPTEDSETQKFNLAHVQQTRQEYSRLTETHLFTMMIETLSGTILLIDLHQTLSS